MSKTKRRVGNKAVHHKVQYVNDTRLKGQVRNRPLEDIPASDRPEILEAKFHSDAGPHSENQTFQRRSVRKLRQLGRAFVKAVTRNPELADSKVAPAKKESRVVGL